MILSNNPWVIGIDEAGRWPLAGPVWVGAVFCWTWFFDKELPSWVNEIQDSKKLSSWQRAYLASCILSDPNIVCAVSLVSAKYIDKYGIVAAIRKASLEVIEEIRMKIRRNAFDKTIKDLSTSLHFAQDDKSQGIIVQLDGKTDYGLRQKLDIPLETIIKWDQKIRQIAAASIIAKVQRDQYMVDLAHKKKYQLYQFDRHKGYGTLIHRKAIVDYGLSDQHRKSFCRNLFPKC